MKKGAVVIVASAGGLPALQALLAELPRSFPLPLVLAQHMARTSASDLPALLAWRGPLPARWAASGQPLQAGMIDVVPPGQGLVLVPEGPQLAPLPATHRGWFDSVDLLLQSLAAGHGERAIAITLSGMLPAGLAGLRAVRAAGGLAMAQSPGSSTHFDMPQAAIDLGKAEIVYPPERLGQALLIAAGDGVLEPA